MACRDYEFDYEKWLERSRERLDTMTAMLRQLCETVKRQSLQVPPAVAMWLAERKAKDEVPLTKSVFDSTARMLCLMCRAAEEKSLAMPPSVAAWWAEHRARDEQPEDLAQGLQPTPIYADFWEEHAAKNPDVSKIAGINHLDAVRALETAGFRVLHQGRRITMTDGTRKIIIPRHDPVNPYAMARIISIAGLKEEEFLKLLEIRPER